MKLTIEQMREIVDGAPEGVRYYCASAEVYHLCDDLLSFECCISLSDLRAAIADHDRTDHCSDIKNHISPTTKVIEHE
jgi:hypothetical protein